MSAPVLVQSAATTGGSAPSANFTFGTPQIEGNCNIVLFAYSWTGSDPGISSLVDSQGNVYTPGAFDATEIGISGAHGYTIGSAYCLSIKGGTTEVVFNVHLGATAVNIFGHEWGSNLRFIYDLSEATSSGITASATATVGIDTHQAGEVLDCIAYVPGVAISSWTNNVGAAPVAISGSGDAACITSGAGYPQFLDPTANLASSTTWSFAAITLRSTPATPFFSLNS